MKLPLLTAALLGASGYAATASLEDARALKANGAATKYENTFSMGYQVATNIKAPPAKVWKLLTVAKDYPTWNSTVISIDGNIAQDEDIVLKAKIAPDRDFKLHVSEFDANRKMVWEDGTSGIFKGIRTYTLMAQKDGSTNFTMIENFAGAMLPMIHGDRHR